MNKKDCFSIIFILIILIFILLNSRSNNYESEFEDIIISLNDTKEKTNNIVLFVKSGVTYSPIEGIRQIGLIEKEVDNLELRWANLSKEYNGLSDTDRLVYAVHLQSSRLHIDVDRRHIIAIMIENEGLEVTPEFVEKILDELQD